MIAWRLKLLLLLTLLPHALFAEPARLVAEANQADALVRPVQTGEKLLRLPGLTYRIGIEARCANDDRAESLSVSVADTRTTLLRDELADTTNITVDITIPASQVAPLAADNFCSQEDSDDHKRLVEDVFTASLSLRCSGGGGESIIYASRPLAVALTCDRGTQGDSDSSILR